MAADSNEQKGDEARFVSAGEAAQALGVAIPTLYAYVGRKHIRTQRIPGTRQTQYWWPDIERVRSRESARREQNSPGVVHETSITLMTQRGPYFRGQSAIELAKSHSFESVAALLWNVDEASVFTTRPIVVPKEFLALRKLLQHAGPVDLASALYPFIERDNPRAFDLSRQGMARTGAELLRWFACIHCGLGRPETRPVHETIAKSLKVDGEPADLIRSILVLSADHGFESATYAVRACATAGLTPYRSVLAGLAVVTGRRSNMGRSETVTRLLQEIAAASDPTQPIVRRLKDGVGIPGFGSNYYRAGDPRARFLLQRYEATFGDKDFRKLRKAIAAVKDLCDLEPDFVFANAYGYLRLGLQSRHSLFALGRSAGWIAHSIEQFEAGEALRATETYTGLLPS